MITAFLIGFFGYIVYLLVSVWLLIRKKPR